MATTSSATNISIYLYPASMFVANTDNCNDGKSAGVFIATPTIRFIVVSYGAIVLPSGVEHRISACYKRGRNGRVRAPAGDAPVLLDAAGMGKAGAYRVEQRSRGRRRLAVVVVAPALNLPVAPQPAGVLAAGGEGGERAGRGVRLPVLVVAPAGCRTVGTEAAGVGAPGGHGGKDARRRRGLAGRVVAPAFNPPVGAEAAGVFVAGADGRKGRRRAGRPAPGRHRRWRPSTGRCRRRPGSRYACRRR